MLLGKRIIVKRIEKKDELIPDTLKQGEVVGVGDKSELGLTLGDRIEFEHYREITSNGETLLVLEDEDVWVKL